MSNLSIMLTIAIPSVLIAVWIGLYFRKLCRNDLNKKRSDLCVGDKVFIYYDNKKVLGKIKEITLSGLYKCKRIDENGNDILDENGFACVVYRKFSEIWPTNKED